MTWRSHGWYVWKVPTRQRIATRTGTWRLNVFEYVCKAGAALSALLSRLRTRPSTIHVADISEDWLSDHATETPKHTDDN